MKMPESSLKLEKEEEPKKLKKNLLKMKKKPLKKMQPLLGEKQKTLMMLKKT